MIAAPRGATAIGLVLCCATAAGCGGSSRSSSAARAVPVAERVCGAARRAAVDVIGARMRLRIADSDPANVECVLRGAGARVDVVALASPRAWTFYDTTVVHQAQAFGSGRGDRGALPQPVSGMGNAVWIPSDHQLVATNGSESQGGSYVTVTITGRPAHGRLPVSLAKAVGIATLASAPRGSNPGPPPS